MVSELQIASMHAGQFQAMNTLHTMIWQLSLLFRLKNTLCCTAIPDAKTKLLHIISPGWHWLVVPYAYWFLFLWRCKKTDTVVRRTFTCYSSLKGVAFWLISGSSSLHHAGDKIQAKQPSPPPSALPLHEGGLPAGPESRGEIALKHAHLSAWPNCECRPKPADIDWFTLSVYFQVYFA